MLWNIIKTFVDTKEFKIAWKKSVWIYDIIIFNKRYRMIFSNN